MQLIDVSSRADRLSSDELAYHLAVLTDVQQAQAAWQSWLAHLARKYELEQGDTIERSGAILRQLGGRDANV